MASISLTQSLTLSIFAIFRLFHMINAIDTNPILDFQGPADVDGTFFSFNGLRQAFGPECPQVFTGLKATGKEFAALNGLSISMAIFKFPPAGVNPPHYHPRSSELMLVLSGQLQVGFIDTTYKVYTHTLSAGDIFVFPQAMIHYMVNTDPNAPAKVVAAFSSANAGSVIIGNALFGSTLDAEVLAKAFKADPVAIQNLKSGLAPKA